VRWLQLRAATEVATAMSGSREMAGTIRRPSAWIWRLRWPRFKGGSGEDSREAPRSRTGVEAPPGSARDLRRGSSPTTWTLWRWEGGQTFTGDGAGARRLGRGGEERERRGHTCWFGVERGEAKCVRVGRTNRAPRLRQFFVR
jgi:hypothetical protein